MANIAILFDFTLRADGAKTVPTAVPVAHSTFALFTSFSPPPADSSVTPPPSGINTMTLPSGTVETSYLISNAGAQHAANQNYVYVVLVTQNPLLIRGLTFDATSGSPVATCVVESASRRDFQDAVVLQTAALNQGLSRPEFAFDLHVPGGLSYIRIRPTASMTVADGDYIRYSNLKMLGSVDTHVLPLKVTPLLGTNPATAFPDQTSSVNLTFDFKRVTKASNLVAAIDNSQTGLAGIFTSTAWNGEGGAGTIGLMDSSFEAGASFLIYNYQPSRGRDQRYVYVALATQVPLILTKLASTIKSSLPVLVDVNNLPSISVIAAVEASQTQDFEEVVEFGKISTSVPSLSLNTFVPRGLTFIRLRVLRVDGLGPSSVDDWIAFKNCELQGRTVDDGWEKVGENVDKLFTQSSMLFAVQRQSGQLVRFSGVADQWTKVSDTQYQFIGNEVGLYAITSTKDAVVKWNDAKNNWDSIGPAGMEELVCGRTSLYGLNHAGRLVAYNSELNQWNEIVGGPFRSVVANDHFCFGIPRDGDFVMSLQLGTSTWQAISGKAAQLVVAGNALYRIDHNHYVFLYAANTKSWISLGGPFRQLNAQGIQLFGVTLDGLAVLKLKTVQPPLWEQIAGAADSVCSNSDYMAGLRSNMVLLPKGTIRHAPPRHGKRSVMSIPDVGDTGVWLFEFHTKDAVFAGYDGEVTAIIWLREAGLQNSQQISRVLPDTHFRRTGINLLALDSIPKSTQLDQFALRGSDNWLGDHWTLGEVVVWNLKDQVVYDVTVNADVPNFSELHGSDGLHCRPTATIPLNLTSKYTRILVWPYRSLFTSVGHVSLALSTDTYISWAPNSDERFVREAPAYEDMEYADDIELFEGSGQRETPSFVIPVYDLDEEAIERWWTEFQQKEKNWKILDLNCSTVVFLALRAGGATMGIPQEVLNYMNNYRPWSPLEILHFAIELLQKKKTGVWRDVSFWRNGGMRDEL